MLDPDAVAHQQNLLAIHRQTLAYSLQKASKYGGVTLAPPEVRHSIDEARSAIKSLKTTLREQGVEVADAPGDVTLLGENRKPDRGNIFWQRTRIPLLIIVLTVVVFIATSLLGAAANIGPTRQQLQAWGIWSLPFAPAQPDETLIVVVPFFRTEGVMDTDAAHNIAQRVRDGVDTIKLPNVRVEVLEGQQLRADERAVAEALGKRANASMMIWGADTGTKVEVKFLNLRQTELAAAEVTLQEQGAEGRTQVANPKVYAEFVTDDLPQVMSFLSLFAVGQAAYIQNDYPQAAQIIEQALQDVQRAPQNTEGQADAYFRLGWLRNELHQAQQAVAAYDQAIKLSPQGAASYNNRGILRADQGDVAGARADYDQATKLNPQYANAYNNRGVLRKNQGDLAGARTDYDQAIVLNPQYASAYNNRGNLRKNQGDLVGARTDYDQAIVLNPQDANAYNNRGILRADQGDAAGARTDFDQAIVLNPQDALAYYNRSILRENEGDKSGAREDLLQAHELATSDSLRQTTEAALKQLGTK